MCTAGVVEPCTLPNVDNTQSRRVTSSPLWDRSCRAKRSVASKRALSRQNEHSRPGVACDDCPRSAGNLVQRPKHISSPSPFLPQTGKKMLKMLDHWDPGPRDKRSKTCSIVSKVRAAQSPASQVQQVATRCYTSPVRSQAVQDCQCTTWPHFPLPVAPSAECQAVATKREMKMRQTRPRRCVVARCSVSVASMWSMYSGSALVTTADECQRCVGE